MITVVFFKDGFYTKGHEHPTICTMVSYATNCCIQDCFAINKDIHWYESADDWYALGMSYLKINTEINGHINVYSRFKDNLSTLLNRWFPNTVEIVERMEEDIDWNNALKDAKALIGV